MAVAAACAAEVLEPEMDEKELLALNGPAFRLAARMLGSAEEAQDAVQQGYLAALLELRKGIAPDDLRAWFLKVVANAARLQLRGEDRRRRREAAVMREMPTVAEPGAGPEVVAALRVAVAALEEKYRLPVALCCEEGLSQREAAAVLEMPESTVNKYVAAGLERLRAALAKAGYAAAPAAILGGLVHTAPAVPTGLAAAVESILAGKTAGTGAAAVSAAVKGGLVMKVVIGVVAAGALATGLSAFGYRLSAQPPSNMASPPPTAYSLPPTGTNPVTGRETREEVFEFTQKPTVTKQGDKVLIAFASKGKCDATVAIVDKDGKVVRHLASGVLGKNAPWPFKQDSLSQSLEWDGKDDTGKPAPAGCKVKVGLGLKATYDKSFVNPFIFGGSVAMTVDKDGNLYVVRDGNVVRFTREGKYDRTLLPPPAGIAPEKFAGAPWTETRWGEKVMVGAWLAGALPKFRMQYNLGTPVVGPDGRLAVAFYTQHNSGFLDFFGPDGSLPADSIVSFKSHFSGSYIDHKAQNTGGGANHLALSPDGEWLFVSGCGDAVLRHRWKELKPPMTVEAFTAKIFKGEINKAGNDNDHFNLPAGVACDAEGNVYVADTGNNRIQVFKPDGAYVRTLAVGMPQRLAVHPKTGEIYVISLGSGTAKGEEAGYPKLVKLAKDGKAAASHPLPADRAWVYFLAAMALDASADPPAVWLYGKGGRITKVADKGAAFQEVLRLGADVDDSILAGAPGNRAVVDPVREELYVGHGGWGTGFTRLDGRTGKIDPTWKVKHATETAIGPDGLIYSRIMGFGQFIARYDHGGKEVPFPKGVECRDPWKTLVATGAIFTGCKHWSNCWQSGFDVSPNGDIVASVHEFGNDFLSALYPADGRRVPIKDLNMAAIVAAGATKDPYPEALNKRGFRGSCFTLVEVWDKDGGEKCVAAFENPTRGSGAFMDAQGSIYLTNCFTIPGQKGLESLKPGATTYCGPGTLMKLGWKDGSWPLARAVKKGEDPGLPGMKLELRNNWTIGGVAWAVQDAADTFDEGSCGCGHSRFDLDGFARTWLPGNHIRAIQAFDSNGNGILRVGRYGNADCQGKGSLVPDPDIGLCWVYAVAASDEALYVVDGGNRRTLRAKLTYAADETVPAP